MTEQSRESAELRFMHKKSHGKKLKLPDAIHLVTVIRRRCRYFVSADMGIRPSNGMMRIAPNADGISTIERVLK